MQGRILDLGVICELCPVSWSASRNGFCRGSRDCRRSKDSHFGNRGDHNQGPIEKDSRTHAETAQENRPSGNVQTEEATFGIILASRGFAAPTR